MLNYALSIFQFLLFSQLVNSLQILRARVQKCYKEQGVNHQQVCQKHVLKYLESIKNIGNHVANSGEHDLNREQMKAKMRDL